MTRIFDWLQPSAYIGGLGDLFALWQKSDARGRGILLLCFAPMCACIGGLVLSIASFVLFVLPSFILKFLGWVLLIAIFSAGGRYCYGHMMKRYSANDPAAAPGGFNASFSAAGAAYDISYTDVKFTEDGNTEDRDNDSGPDKASGTRRTIFRKSRTKEN